MSFQWDEPFFTAGGIGSASNYDFLLVGNDGVTILPLNPANLVGGQDQGNIGADALEIVTFVNDGSFDYNNDFVADVTFNFAIEHVAGPAAGLVKYVHFGGVTINEFDTQSPTVFGHANTNGAISVGAADFQETPEFGAAIPILEDFSSLGGVDILFDVNGNRLAQPEIREGVDVVGPNGGNTTFLGQDIAGDADTLPNFFGTSAAAPHVAGLAALLLQADRSLTPAEIEDVLEQSAIDMDNPFTAGFDIGFDDATGHGFVDALSAIGLVQQTPQLVGLAPDEYVLVNDNRDLIDLNLGDGVVDADAAMGEQATLRAAVMEANADADLRVILVPEDHYDLSITGTGTDIQGDLDIMGDLTILGTGAGETIVDASGSGGLGDRVFDVATGGALELSRVTLTGGFATGSGENGGAIRVRNGSTLDLSHVAVVENESDTQNAGAIYIERTATATIMNSVVTANHAGLFTGGIFLASGPGTGTAGEVWIGNTIVGNNTAVQTAGVDVLAQTGRQFTSLGNNLLTSTHTNFASIASDVTNGTPDYIVTGVGDTFDHGNDAIVRSLRDAIDDADDDTGTPELWLPGWSFLLTRQRATLSEFAVGEGDLDILGDMTIRGIGPGITRVDGSGFGDTASRVFDVGGSSILNASHLTVHSGDSTGNAENGGGIMVRNGSTLNIDHVAIANNVTSDPDNNLMVNGGGIYFQRTANGSITDSVITNNDADYAAGGVFLSNSGVGTFGSVTMTRTIVARNTATTSPNGEDILAQTRVFTSGGGNLLSLDSDAYGFINGQNGDHFGTPDYVVTTIEDTFDHADDAYSLSLREAVDLANQNDNVAEEIWVAAWDFVLTRSNPGGADTMDVAFGDLDITDSLTIRGINWNNVQTDIAWRPDLATDAVFELIGDYNGDGTSGDVDSADYTVWQDTQGSTTDLRADGNDDGIVNQADYDVWSDHFGNTLDLFAIAV